MLRDTYHTKRMANVLSVLWSMDSKFVFSGSNEMNVRIWKSKAAEKIGPVSVYSSFHEKDSSCSLLHVRKLLSSTARSFVSNSKNILKSAVSLNTDNCPNTSSGTF